MKHETYLEMLDALTTCKLGWLDRRRVMGLQNARLERRPLTEGEKTTIVNLTFKCREQLGARGEHGLPMLAAMKIVGRKQGTVRSMFVRIGGGK